MIKQLIKANLPPSLLQLARLYKNRKYNNLSPEQMFTKIYATGAWGKSDNEHIPFFSGSGSRREEEISAYVSSVARFIANLGTKPDAVDIGCGDFVVGSRIRTLCNNYIACDVVPALIEFNRSRFENLAVDFRVLNLIDDPLPKGDIAFVRQVLQHLSNEQILKFVTRVRATYKYLVVTEHLPAGPIFRHNEDKLAGPGTRMGYQSGVVLTSPPFNLRPKSEMELCRVNSIDTGMLVTTLYAIGLSSAGAMHIKGAGRHGDEQSNIASLKSNGREKPDQSEVKAIASSAHPARGFLSTTSTRQPTRVHRRT